MSGNGAKQLGQRLVRHDGANQLLGALRLVHEVWDAKTVVEEIHQSSHHWAG